MKCSACREMLGAYLDGDLANGAKVSVATHLVGCAACSAFAEELRSVEVRLGAVALIESRADFTSALMARIAAMPLPRVRPFVRGWWLAAYVAVAWIVAAAGITARWISWKPTVVAGSQFAAKIGITGDAFYRISQHFHLLSVAALGVGIEVALIIVLAVVGRKYISRAGATLLGARL